MRRCSASLLAVYVGQRVSPHDQRVLQADGYA